MKVCVCVFVCLTLCADNLHVEVGEAAGCGQGQFDHSFHSDCVAVQVIKQGAMFVVIRHQPQLSPRPIICRQTGRPAKEIRVQIKWGLSLFGSSTNKMSPLKPGRFRLMESVE